MCRPSAGRSRDGEVCTRRLAGGTGRRPARRARWLLGSRDAPLWVWRRALPEFGLADGRGPAGAERTRPGRDGRDRHGGRRAGDVPWFSRICMGPVPRRLSSFARLRRQHPGVGLPLVLTRRDDPAELPPMSAISARRYVGYRWRRWTPSELVGLRPTLARRCVSCPPRSLASWRMLHSAFAAPRREFVDWSVGTSDVVNQVICGKSPLSKAASAALVDEGDPPDAHDRVPTRRTRP